MLGSALAGSLVIDGHVVGFADKRAAARLAERVRDGGAAARVEHAEVGAECGCWAMIMHDTIFSHCSSFACRRFADRAAWTRVL